MVGATPRRINLPQLHSYIDGVLHGGVLELMASCGCRFLGLTALSFLNGIVEAGGDPIRCVHPPAVPVTTVLTPMSERMCCLGVRADGCLS
jgi:hypothetical protein